MFRMTLIKNDQSAAYDITPIVGDMSWDSDFTLTVPLEFTLAYSDARWPVPHNIIDLGDMVILTKGSVEIYRGILLEDERTGRGPIKYLSYDGSWHLNESTTVIQFNKDPATKAIRRVLETFGIPIGTIPQMATLVDKIYFNKTPGQIIQDIIDQVSKKEGYALNGEMRSGKIYLERRQDLLIEGEFSLADNLTTYPSTAVIGSPKRSRTLMDMRNRIRIIAEDEETEYEVTAMAEDPELIEQYGLLEGTYEIDVEDAAKSRQVASILLKRLGRIQETNEVKLMGDVRFKAGRLVDIEEPITGISGRLMIVSVKHEIKNQIHTMQVEFALPEDVA